MTVSQWMLLKMRNVSHEICRQNQNTHFMFSNFFWKSCRLWDNVGRYGRARETTDDDITWRMRFACWIIKTIIQTQFFYIVMMVTRTRLSVALYISILPVLLEVNVVISVNLPLWQVNVFIYFLYLQWLSGILVWCWNWICSEDHPVNGATEMISVHSRKRANESKTLCGQNGELCKCTAMR